MQGRVIKEIASIFFVEVNNDIYQCKARGRIKREIEKICVGDLVELSKSAEEWVIEKALPRTNFLLRPAVSNVDQIVVVVACQPQPDFLLIDKMIINSVLNSVNFVLCINKSDMVSDGFVDFVFKNYQNAVDKIVVMSAKTENGLCALKDVLKGKISCLAGQSAVGKSSITNLLSDKNQAPLEIGDVSERSQRGKHTTRHCELIQLELGGYLIDTPGFTFFDGLSSIEPCDLESYYIDFHSYLKDCKFRGCTHIHEPVCGVKNAVKSNAIHKERYERYVYLYQELKTKWDNRY